jgi:hypothetical protein
MKTLDLISKHLKELYFGNNWTGASFPTVTEGIDWNLAVKQRDGFNSIATLIHHMNFYVIAAIDAINGATSILPDKASFINPIIQSEEDWTNLKQRSLDAVTQLLELLSQQEDDLLLKTFVVKAHGNYYRFIQGLIEHSHYHLGQIMILKKLG